MFEHLREPHVDVLMALGAALRADLRSEKLDLGVGVYRDEHGRTPVLRAVKAAERRLWEEQDSKGYLGPAGDTEFIALLGAVVTGSPETDPRLVGVQAPGGTGALRLALELVATSTPAARVWVGLPTWPNHTPMLAASGLELATYNYYDLARRRLTFDRMIDALGRAKLGDVVLLHGCCHNPTGADLGEVQWDAVADLIERRGLVPLVDFAYQGFGEGPDADARGVRRLLARVPEALVAVSCSKSFGLYRERTGLLLALAASPSAAARVGATLQSLARLIYSNPPDHGAAVVRTILSDRALKAEWLAELAAMRQRVARVRAELLAAGSRTGMVGSTLLQGRGLFALLPICRETVLHLRNDYGIYLPDNGRINLAGLNSTGIVQLAGALGRPAKTRLSGGPLATT